MREIKDIDVTRDFVNAKGTRYTKAPDRVARDKDGVWLALAKDGNQWVIAMVNVERGVELNFRIIPAEGAVLLNGIQAYHVALHTYDAFVLGNIEAKKHFKVGKCGAGRIKPYTALRRGNVSIPTLIVWTAATVGILVASALENVDALLLFLIASGMTMAVAFIELLFQKPKRK